MPYLKVRRYSLYFETKLSAIVENDDVTYENTCPHHLGNNLSVACTLCLEYVIAVNEPTAKNYHQSAVKIRDLHPLKRTERYIAQRKTGVWKSLQELKANKDFFDNKLFQHCNQLSEAKHQKFGIERALNRKQPTRCCNLFACIGLFK